jgi:protocatechuate 3,4-dioxygenase beta subunit
MGKDLYEIGELPPVGEVPARMHAQLVRPDRYGDPEKAIQDEVIDVPELGPHDALVMVMAAGVNFNIVWDARGVPVDVPKTQARWGEPTDFHIVGSDASGVVYAVGDQVTNVKVGDPVVVHAGQWDPDDPWVKAGKDPGLAGTFRVWGYDTKRPLAGVVLDFWHVVMHEKYSNGTTDFRNRGRVVSSESGLYEVESIRPIPYRPNPDGSPDFWRCAHFHLVAMSPGYQTLVTEIHFHGDPHKNDPMYRIENAISVEQRSVNGKTFEAGVFDIVLERNS